MPGGPDLPGTLRVAVGEDIWPLTGQGPTAKHFSAGELSAEVFEPLVSLGPDHSVRPGLAERWEPVEGGWRFHLRAGVTFHDGRPLTADDVVWSWSERELYPSSVRSSLAPVGVVAVAERTVEFRTLAPDNRLPEKLAHPEGPIVARDCHNDSAPPVGTGPYRVVDYRPRQRLMVEAYPGYWGPAPSVARLTFVFMPDPASRLEALRNGTVDVAANLPGAVLAGAELGPGIQVIRAPAGAVQTLTFNPGGGTAGPGPAADAAVRRAVALSLDRHRYVASVLGGEGEPGRWMTPPTVLGAAADLVTAPTFDRAAAQVLLEAAGWTRGPDGVRQRGGTRLTLTIVAGPPITEGALSEVRSQLSEVGIEVAAKHASDAAAAARFRSAGYDADLGMPNQNDANPAFLVGLRAAGELGAGQPDLVAATAAALAAATRAEAQVAAAAGMEILVNREALVVPLATVGRLHALAAGVRLGEPHPSALSQRWSTLVDGR